MTLANISYKNLKTRLSLLILLIVSALTACGNKTNPLPPLTVTPKQPEKPAVFQKGDSIVVKFANPFIGRTDNWKMKLYRVSKVLMPTTEKGSSSSSEGKNKVIAEKPELVVLSKEDVEFRKSYPELPKLDAEQFIDGSMKIMEISGKAKTSDYSREIFYIDPKKYDSKKIHPEAFYYAINAEDPRNEIGSYSGIAGITILPVEIAPAITDWKVEKESLNLMITPPGMMSENKNDLKYFTGFNIYKGDCETPQKTAVLAKPFEYIPVDWTVASVLRIIPLKSDGESQKSGVGVLFGGRKKQEIRQSVADDKSISLLCNAVLHISVELRCPNASKMEVKIQFDDGREGKLVETQFKAEKDWKVFESDFNVYHAARKLDIIISPEDSLHVSYLEIKKISLTVSKLTPVETPKEPEKTQPSENKPAPTKKESSPEKKNELKIGDELITNGGFSEFPKLVLKDEKYSLEKDICYSAVSTLKFDDNYYESENGTPVKVYIKDVFVPETVKGLYSLAKLDSITLIWQPSKDKDLAGYNVYRKGENEEKFIKVNSEPIRNAEYTDAPPEMNVKYKYYIVAVDKSLSANESKPSETVEFIARADINPQR